MKQFLLVFLTEAVVPSVKTVDGSDVGVSSCPLHYQPLKVPAFLSGATAASMVGGVRNFSINLVLKDILMSIWIFLDFVHLPGQLPCSKG